MWKWLALGIVVLWILTRTRSAAGSGGGTPVGLSSASSALPNTVGENPRAGVRPTLSNPVPAFGAATGAYAGGAGGSRPRIGAFGGAGAGILGGL